MFYLNNLCNPWQEKIKVNHIRLRLHFPVGGGVEGTNQREILTNQTQKKEETSESNLAI